MSNALAKKVIPQAQLRPVLKEIVPLPPPTDNATDDTCMDVMDVGDKELLALLENPDAFQSVENVPSEKKSGAVYSFHGCNITINNY